jgi:hypothetical protein
MHAKDVILQTLNLNESIVTRYLGDLEDADLLIRPVEGMNHIAWQLGHLISSERGMVEAIRPGSCPALPDGFETNYAREDTSSDDPARFLSRDGYLALFRAQREATKQVLDSLSDEEMDAPSPERFRQRFPTVGSIFVLIGTHVIMHVGQFVAVRRKRKKPIAI